MGHHYVPQGYLRQFATSPGSGELWQYDKRSGSSLLLPIKNVAQARDFYEADVERQLATVEGAAHAVLKRVVATPG